MIRYKINILFTYGYMKKPALIEVEKLIGLKVEPYRTSYSDKQCILYALGIGFSIGTFM
jgi:hypothetical protein